MRINHDIFNTPNPVELSIEDKPTPDNYRRYTEGHELPETMPMWRVQTEGYSDETGQPVGMVSRDAGFLDTPDTEWISGGKNSKGPNAVAIGRHGNFFLWGFAASPTYLTDEGKLVFVNSIHYIARFDGQTPIARKDPNIMPREYVADAILSMSDEAYEQTKKFYAGFRKQDAAKKKELQVKLDAGEELSRMEQAMLKRPPTETPSRFKQVRRMLTDEEWAALGEDPVAIENYLRSNLGYMRPGEQRYSLVIDEELQAFGIASDNLILIPKLIEALGNPEQAATAQNLLLRYTTEDFDTQQDWRAWYDRNCELLFFTEVCGFKWMVNRPARRGTPKAASAPKPEPSPNQPLAAGLSIKALGDHRYALTLQVEILDGWHGYDAVAAGSPYTPMQPELVLPAGLQLDGDWQRPPSHPDLVDPTIAIFEGSVTFHCELIADADLDPTSTVTCRLSYMVCDERSCLPPTVEEFQTRLPN